MKERTDENSSHGVRGCWWLLRGTTRSSWVRGGLHCTRRSSRGVAREGACRREQAWQYQPPKGTRDRRSDYSGIRRRQLEPFRQSSDRKRQFCHSKTACRKTTCCGASSAMSRSWEASATSQRRLLDLV